MVVTWTYLGMTGENFLQNSRRMNSKCLIMSFSSSGDRNNCCLSSSCINEIENHPHCEKIGLRVFRPGLTQPELYNNRVWLKA